MRVTNCYKQLDEVPRKIKIESINFYLDLISTIFQDIIYIFKNVCNLKLFYFELKNYIFYIN